MGQHAVELNEVGRELHDLGALRIMRAFGRGDQQGQDESRHRRDQPNPGLYYIPGIRVQMMLRQDGPEEHPEHRAPKDTQEHDQADCHRAHG